MLLDRCGGDVTIEAKDDARLLVPSDAPVAMQGPFVMDSADEIRQAIADCREGRFGAIASPNVTA